MQHVERVPWALGESPQHRPASCSEDCQLCLGRDQSMQAAGGPLTPDTPGAQDPRRGQSGADRANSPSWGHSAKKREPLAASYFSICLCIQGNGRSPAMSRREMRLPSWRVM